MKSNRQLALGLGMMIAGLVVVGVSTLVASSDVVVGLVLLLLIPLSIAFCGAVVVFIGLVRKSASTGRFKVIRKIVGLGAIAGVGFGFGFPALGILGQLPDWAAGVNGAFISGSTAGFSAFLLAGFGLLAGLVSGILVAFVWWVVRGRSLPLRAAAQDT